MLNHSQARSIAECLWGRGGTHSEPINRPGAFYFSCSGHGGFVIDTACLTDEELEAIKPYVSIEQATEYTWGNRSVFMHPYRRRSSKVSVMAIQKTVLFFVLEEDCDWCLAYLFTGIRHKNKPAKGEDAQRTFNQWIKPRVAA